MAGSSRIQQAAEVFEVLYLADSMMSKSEFSNGGGCQIQSIYVYILVECSV